jgi:hypothetical protein
MLENSDGGVSRLFQLDRLLSEHYGPWRIDEYTSHGDRRGGSGEEGFEGVIELRTDRMVPDYIRYISLATGQEVTVLESDTIRPTVTVNQAAGQADPISSTPISFTVVFSEAVTGFGDSSSDVILGGTARSDDQGSERQRHHLQCGRQRHGAERHGDG